MTKTKRYLIVALITLLVFSFAQVILAANLNVKADVLTPYSQSDGLNLTVGKDAGDGLEITATYNGSLVYEYQYWIKEKVQTDIGNEADDQYIWRILPGGAFSTESTYTIQNIDDLKQYVDADGRINVIVRIREENGEFFDEAYGAYTLEEINIPVITSIMINGNALDKGEVVLSKQDIDITVNSNLEGLSYSIEGYPSLTADVQGKVAYFYDVPISQLPVGGIYKITIWAGSAKKEITLNVIDDYIANQRPVITSLSGESNGDGETVFTMKVRYADGSAMTKAVAQSFVYKLSSGKFSVIGSPQFDGSGNLIIDDENNASILFDIDYSGYGIYQTTATVARNVVTGADDTFILWYRGYTAKAIDGSVVKLKQTITGDDLVLENGIYKGIAKNSINITAEGSIGGNTAVKYAFYREDASGWVLIRDYPKTEGVSGERLTWTPQRPGTYNIQVRMKDPAAGSFEEMITAKYQIGSSVLVGKPGIEIYDYDNDESEEAKFIIAGNPYKIKAVYNGANAEKVLYSFLLTNQNLGTIYLSNFSTSPYYMFIPWKGDDFTITARVIYMDSYGYMDIYSQREITALYAAPLAPVPQGGYVENFFVGANNESKALENLAEKYPGYIFDSSLDLTAGAPVTATVKYNTDDTQYMDYTYTAKIYWEYAAKLQPTSGAVTSSDIITSTTYSETSSSVPQNVSYSSTFIQNDTVRISGTGGTTFVYYYWKTNYLAQIIHPNPNFTARAYIQNNLNTTNSYYRWSSANDLQETLDQKTEVVTLQNTDATLYWTIQGQQFAMDGSSNASIGVYDGSGNAVATKDHWENVNGNDMYWIIAFPICVWNSEYDFSITLVMDNGQAPSGNKAPAPVGGYAQDFFVMGGTEAEAKANLASKYPGYIFDSGLTLTRGAVNQISAVYNTDRTMFDDHTYTANIYWESSGVQSVSGAVTSSDIITSSTYIDSTSSVPQNVTHSSTFMQNDTVRISGSGGTEFVYFYWKTDHLAIQNWIDSNFTARVYIHNNLNTTNSFYRWGSCDGISETLDQKTEIVAVQNTNYVFYWTLLNQQFAMDGSGHGSIGVYDGNGNAVITNPWENVNGNDMYWIIAFPIYVWNGAYDFSITLVMETI